ncbi:MAG TPA: sugar phosphate nucleotidyltransferase [Longimicrobiales bacterium]
MKGVVLAGGLGTRLHPLTRVTNKHLLPVYDRPMIFYPIEKLVEAGIDDILVVTGGSHAGEFLRLLGNGKEFGLKHLNYAYQEGEGGIGAALSLAEHFADGGPVVVILGDNLFEDSLAEAVRRFRHQGEGAKIFLKEVPDPERFGVPVFDADRVVDIIEKPEHPPSRFAVAGVYMYDARVFDIIRTLKPSGRGELEITDVNNRYIEWDALTYEVLEGWWTDAGTFDSLYRASALVRRARLQNRRVPESGDPQARHAIESESRRTGGPDSSPSARRRAAAGGTS